MPFQGKSFQLSKLRSVSFHWWRQDWIIPAQFLLDQPLYWPFINMIQLASLDSTKFGGWICIRLIKSLINELSQAVLIPPRNVLINYVANSFHPLFIGCLVPLLFTLTLQFPFRWAFEHLTIAIVDHWASWIRAAWTQLVEVELRLGTQTGKASPVERRATKVINKANVLRGRFLLHERLKNTGFTCCHLRGRGLRRVWNICKAFLRFTKLDNL